MSQRVSVAVRVRPPFKSELKKSHTAVRVVNASTLQLDKDTSSQGRKREFTFDRVFHPKSSQKDVYEAVGSVLVQNVVDGFNATLLAYGQTGTGKTYTMGILNEVGGHADDGVIPRSIKDLFTHIQSRPFGSWHVSMSFVQIYMENIQDLIDPEAQNLNLREDPEEGVFVEGTRWTNITNYSEAARTINSGLHNRMMAPTLMNSTSSRSHTVLTLDVIQEFTVGEEGESRVNTSSGPSKQASMWKKRRLSKLVFVDLAGSERVSKTRSLGARLDEAKAINTSLQSLGQVIRLLAAGTNTHIPYRNSKLTRLLQDSLGGNTSTALIATIGPSAVNQHETLSTLMFAQRCMAVETYAIVNENIDYIDMCSQLNQQLVDLKQKYMLRENILHARYQKMIGEGHDGGSADDASRLGYSLPLLEHGEADAGGLRAATILYKLLGDVTRVTNRAMQANADRVAEETANAGGAHLRGGHRPRILTTTPPEPLPENLPPLSAFRTTGDLIRYLSSFRDSLTGQLNFLSELTTASMTELSTLRGDVIAREAGLEPTAQTQSQWALLVKNLVAENDALRKKVRLFSQPSRRSSAAPTRLMNDNVAVHRIELDSELDMNATASREATMGADGNTSSTSAASRSVTTSNKRKKQANTSTTSQQRIGRVAPEPIDPIAAAEQENRRIREIRDTHDPHFSPVRLLHEIRDGSRRAAWDEGAATPVKDTETVQPKEASLSRTSSRRGAFPERTTKGVDTPGAKIKTAPGTKGSLYTAVLHRRPREDIANSVQEMKSPKPDSLGVNVTIGPQSIGTDGSKGVSRNLNYSEASSVHPATSGSASPRRECIHGRSPRASTDRNSGQSAVHVVQGSAAAHVVPTPPTRERVSPTLQPEPPRDHARGADVATASQVGPFPSTASYLTGTTDTTDLVSRQTSTNDALTERRQRVEDILAKNRALHQKLYSTRLSTLSQTSVHPDR